MQITRSRLGSIVLLSLVIFGAYCFPRIWYRNSGREFLWLAEARELPHWTRKTLPLSQAAETQLGADACVNAEFTRNDGRIVRFFSAKRFSKEGAEACVFAHTPDRCWPLAGWKLEKVEPEVREVVLYRTPVLFERRCFRGGENKELVYFGALIGGQPLPFRLDQYLGFGLRASQAGNAITTEAFARAKDKQFWAWMWNCFRARRTVGGATHFIRISTPVTVAGVASGDQLLLEFLQAFLQPADFETDLRQWKQTGRAQAGPEERAP
jgi:hypothetical protein